MIPKYSIEYSTPFRGKSVPAHHTTDDPVAAEEFVEELLERGFRIHSIKHEGLDLQKHEFDRMVRKAAGMMASRHICTSLGIASDEEKYRFGYAA